MTPALEPARYKKQFSQFDLQYGRHFQPSLQMLEVAILSLNEPRAESFHAQFLKASCSAEERWLFCHIVLLSRDRLDPRLKRILEWNSFFSGIDSRLPLMNVLELEATAFGDDGVHD